MRFLDFSSIRSPRAYIRALLEDAPARLDRIPKKMNKQINFLVPAHSDLNSPVLDPRSLDLSFPLLPPLSILLLSALKHDADSKQ